MQQDFASKGAALGGHLQLSIPSYILGLKGSSREH